MAVVTLTIKDNPDGTVEFVSTPSAQTMLKMHVSGAGLTSAHGFALACINRMLQEKKGFKKQKPALIIPKIV